MRHLFIAAFTVLVFASFAHAQARNLGAFDEKAPKVGELAPDITVYDADGKEFRLRSIKGHYTVLVFGCLT